MKTSVYDSTGKVTKEMELPKKIFGEKVNISLLSQAIRVFLSNQRRAKAKAQTRGEVNRTKAKWFRQKGTGRARHGSRSAPIFVGGGVAHGPRGNQNYNLLLPKTLKRQALVSALNLKLKEKNLVVIEDFGKITTKTKEMSSLLGKISEGKKALLVVDKKTNDLNKATRNIPFLKVVEVKNLNTFGVVNGGKIVLSQGALKTLEK